MKVASIGYKIASWTLVLGGILHTLSDLLSPSTPERKEIILQMNQLTGEILGTSFSMFDFFQGFSLMMGLLLFGYGAINILILQNLQKEVVPINIVALNVLITFICVVLSYKYFFVLPIVLTSIAFLGYTTSLIYKVTQE